MLEYKRSSLPAATVPQPANAVGQGDLLAKYPKQEPKGKMLALYNKLKNNCDGIKQDACADDLGTTWEDAVDDNIKKAMKDKDR